MKALLTGARGMLGRNIAEAWRRDRGSEPLVEVIRSRADLLDPGAVDRLMNEERPDVVIHAAARVGGIVSKIEHPTKYLRENVMIDANVVGSAQQHGVGRLVYVGSAAIYPEAAPQPIRAESLLTGELEPANEGYALAKIAGAKLCEYISREFGVDYRTIVPSNLYGPGEKFSGTGAHLIAAALDKVQRAKDSGSPSVSIWGDGLSRREFTFAPDLASWLVGAIDSIASWPHRLNIGAGTDHSIREYYDVARKVVAYHGEFDLDLTKPSGSRRRLLDSSVAVGLGWRPVTPLEVGMRIVHEDLLRSVHLKEN